MQNVPGNSDVDEAMLDTATAMSMVCPIGLAAVAVLLSESADAQHLNKCLSNPAHVGLTR
jgi:predicted transporter